MSTESDRVRIATGLGYRWVSAEYVGLSACPPASKNRLFFLDRPLGQWGEWILTETMEAGQMNRSNIDRLPRWDEDANAALQICEFMRGKGFEIYLEANIDGSKGWQCYFGRTIPKGIAETLPAAICAAFLKYLDSEKGGWEMRQEG